MRTAKKDIKYIIKRILIGVGIAMILANLNKCNVYADTNDIYIINNTSSTQNNLITNSLYNGNSIYKVFNVPYNNNYNINLTNSSNQNNYSFNYIVFYNQSLNIYFYLYFYDIFYSCNLWPENYSDCFDMSKINISSQGNVPVTYQFLKRSNNDYDYIGGLARNFLLTSSDIDVSLYSLSNNIYTYNVNNQYYIKNGSSFSGSGSSMIFNPTFSIFEDFEIFDTNFTEISINGVQQDIPVVPPGYSMVDWTGNDAIYFVPKNYSTINYSVIDSKKYIDFPFYYSGIMRQSYFNLYNVNEFQFSKPDLTSIDLEYGFVSFPMHFSNSISEDLSAVMFNRLAESNDTIIYYDSTLFDYHIIHNLDRYYEDISFIDDEGNQTVMTLKFEDWAEDSWLHGFQSGGDNFVDNSCSNDGLCSNNIESYLNLLKLPFNWLKSLNKDSCVPLSIPIPFVNGNIQINCLSGLFKNVLGITFFNIILYIISGLYAYRITLMNIDTITDVVDPSDDKLEVVEL